MLFKTATCPNCKMAEKFLNDAGIIYETVYANEQPELAKEYGIMQAPTLVVIKDGKMEKIANVSNIRKFIDSVKA
jgi:ribonucleoside-triphosphate reductase